MRFVAIGCLLLSLVSLMGCSGSSDLKPQDSIAKDLQGVQGQKGGPSSKPRGAVAKTDPPKDANNAEGGDAAKN